MKVSKLGSEAFRPAQPSPAATPKAEPPRSQQQLKSFVRVRPLLKPQTSESIRVLDDRQIQVIAAQYPPDNDPVFSYERVFKGSASNRELFQSTMLEPISNVLSGFNSTVLIYGMTGAGKSYTMFNQGKQGEDLGLVGQAVSRLFGQVHAEKRSTYALTLSFYEIYNENIRDLLSESSQTLAVLEDPLRGVFINELTETPVQCQAQAKEVIEVGLEKRAINSTNGNLASSRSHAILQLNVKKYTEQQCNEAVLQQSKLFMIDLAGNQKTGRNESKRFIEGVNINKSLLTLGKCINILAEQKKKAAFIPFRDSKLTRILKDSLGGNSKTVMIACVSSDLSHYEQTINTLKYSSKAKRITNSLKSNARTITKSELPSRTVSAQETLSLQHQQAIFAFVNSMESLLKKKGDLERAKDDIQLCLYENQRAQKEGVGVEARSQHISEMKALILELNKRLSSLANEMEEEIQRFAKNVGQIMRQSSNNGKQQTANLSNDKIFMLQKQKSAAICALGRDLVRTEQSLQSKNSGQITPISLCDNFANSMKSSGIQQKGKRQHKSKIRCIKIEQNQGPNKQNVALNKQNVALNKQVLALNKQVLALDKNSKPFTPDTSLKSFNSRQDQNAVPFKRLDKQPKISISITPAQPQKHVLNSKAVLAESSMEYKLVTVGDKMASKQSLGLRLKQIDKMPDAFSLQALNCFLQELDRQRYELSKVERSMVNKLKFMLKNREGSCQNARRLQKQLKGHRDTSLDRL